MGSKSRERRPWAACSGGSLQPLRWDVTAASPPQQQGGTAKRPLARETQRQVCAQMPVMPHVCVRRLALLV